jgi:hypothetical protein
MSYGTYAGLRAMTVSDLKKEYDRRAYMVNVGIDFLVAEIARRETESQTALMLKITKTVRDLTWVITWLTIVNVVVAVVGVVLATRVH